MLHLLLYSYHLAEELSLDMLQFAMRQQEAALKHANASNAAWREEQLNMMANLSAAQLQALAEVHKLGIFLVPATSAD